MRIFYWDTLFLKKQWHETHTHTEQKCFGFFIFRTIDEHFVVFISRLFVSFNFSQYCNNFGYTLGEHVMWTAKVPMSTEKRKIKINERKEKILYVYVYIKESDCEKTPDAPLNIPYFCYHCPRIVPIPFLCYLLDRNAEKPR